ncbi:rab effector MyRIP isoform X2 [Coregonus clupeaformis]|uniref:rab effector MyRIP isoform X2 n=1 Tax=Coregonus clupeaformis TaxID=59861 RepID=UPI001E1C8191|nr:rab effector MyRIP isoform X2 [Coregonus clupeaformis]
MHARQLTCTTFGQRPGFAHCIGVDLRRRSLRHGPGCPELSGDSGLGQGVGLTVVPESAMRRKLDMSGLTDDEAEHVLQVVQRDMRLRKKEDERLSELKQELDEEDSRCSLLSRQHRFNERCCIRCCSPFTFLVNPKRPCLDCQYNVCKTCRSYSKKDKAWVCSACQKGRLLKTQSLEWYYNNVKCRFKRFGSAKVLKTLYRKHLAEHGTLGELTEGSTYEESIGNEGSICSENAFYRQSEEHSMAETLTVALRVAEEAIDEAIAKAEGHTDSPDKQSEARYLRDHREELIEELTTTIVQKIIRRRKNLAEMKPDYDLDWPPDNQSGDQPLVSSSPSSQPQISCTTSARAKASIWRSHSAFSLLDDNVVMQCSGVSQDSQQGLKKEGGVAGLANWKSVDRLDNSMLKSPDGNWMALQSTQLSRPSLLTKRKSLVFSVLERESGVISAYDEMGSDDAEGGEGAWGAALLEIRRKMTNNNQGSEAPDAQASSDQQHSLPSPLLGYHASTDTLNSESEVGEDQIQGQGPKPQKPLLAVLKRKVPVEHRCTPSSRRSSRPGIFDVNFNPEGIEAESSGADELEEGGKVRRTRRRKRTKKDQGEGRGEEYSNMLLDDLSKKLSVKKTSQSGAVTPDTLTLDGGLTSRALTPEPWGPEGEAPGCGAPEGQGGRTTGVTINLEQELTIRLRELASQVSLAHLSSTEDELDRPGEDEGGREGRREGNQAEERLWHIEVEMEGGRAGEGEEEKRTKEREGDGGGELKSTLIKLASQVRGTEFSSTEDELDRVGRVEEWEREWEEKSAKKREREGREELTVKLRMLASQVTHFSSTEEELDRVGVSDGEMEEKREGEREGEKEELAYKLCRLARQVNAAQLSSTEDELDKVGLYDEEMEKGRVEREGEREEIDAEALWEMEGDKEELTSKLRDLASLVSASQFSSTEDELDRVGKNEGEREEEEEEEEEEERAEGSKVDRLKSSNRVADWVGERRGSMEGKWHGERWGEMEGERRRGQVERVSEKPWYLGVMMEVEGRMRNEERRDSVGELDVRLFDFEDESEKEGELQSEETDTKVEEEGVMKVQRMMERMFEGVKEGKRAGEAERKVEGGMGEAEVGERERERTESGDTVEEEVMFDDIISSLVNTLGGMEVEMDGEMVADPEREEREEDKNKTKVRETEFKEEEEVDEYLINEMLMLEQLSDRFGTLDKTGVKPQEKVGGKKRLRDSWDKTVESVVERGGKKVGEKDEQTETETHKSLLPQNLDERKEQVSDQTKKETSRDLEEESKRVERGGDEGGEVEEQTSEKEMDDFGEREGENFGKNTDEKEKETEGNRTKDPEESSPCVQEEILSSEEIQNRYSAMSLRSITTEVLKVLNATEDLLQGVEEGDYACSPPYTPSLPLNTDTKRLDEQLSRLEENVYVAAGTAYGLEAELDDLEECARAIGDATSDLELSYLEEQVASAAAQIHQSDLQTQTFALEKRRKRGILPRVLPRVSDIAARITALKNAGLNVVPQNRFTKPKKQPKIKKPKPD